MERHGDTLQGDQQSEHQDDALEEEHTRDAEAAFGRALTQVGSRKMATPIRSTSAWRRGVAAA